MVDKKVIESEREKKIKRRAYMKKYYMKRKYNLGNGKTTRCKEKLKEGDHITTIKKTYGEFIITFD